MKRYEFRIEILDENYTDELIVTLTRQGYAPYLSPNNELCITVSENELEEIEQCPPDFMNN